jgi:hypothetical protein
MTDQPCDCEWTPSHVTFYITDEAGQRIGDAHTYQRLPDGTLILSEIEEAGGEKRKLREEN